MKFKAIFLFISISSTSAQAVLCDPGSDDLFARLGVEDTASEADLKKAHRELTCRNEPYRIDSQSF